MDGNIPTSWPDTLVAYSEYLMNHYASARTPEIYLRHLRVFSEWCRVPPAEVEALQLQSYLASRNWAISTMKNVQQAFKSFCGWAYAQHIIPRDITANWATIRVPVRPTRPAKRNDVEAARKKAQPRVRLMIDLIRDAGLTPMELANSHSRDLDFVDGAWWLDVHGRAGSQQSIRIPGRIAQQLRAKGDGYFFPGRSEGRLRPSTISRYVSRTLPRSVSARALKGAHRVEETGRQPERSRTEPTHFRATNPSRLRGDLEFSFATVLLEELNAIEGEISSSPARAIDDCKVLLESLFDSVLVERKVTSSLGENPKLGAYYLEVARALEMDADSAPDPTDADGSMQTVLRTLSTTVHQLALIRNDIGRPHGDAVPSPAERRHAYLALNAAMTVAEFVLENWQIVRDREQSGPRTH